MDIETIIANQRAFYESGQSRPLAWRQSALRKLREAVQENEDKINQALYLDLQKSAHEAYMAEIGLVLDEIRFHNKHLKGWMRGACPPLASSIPLVHLAGALRRGVSPLELRFCST